MHVVVHTGLCAPKEVELILPLIINKNGRSATISRISRVDRRIILSKMVK